MEPAHQDLPHNSIADLPGATDAAEIQAGSLNGKCIAILTNIYLVRVATLSGSAIQMDYMNCMYRGPSVHSSLRTLKGVTVSKLTK
jgi:hypothetical protein